MDLLIKHGTWVIVPIGIALSFIYLIVAPKLYPFLAAWSLNEEDARENATYAGPEMPAEIDSGVTARSTARAGSRL